MKPLQLRERSILSIVVPGADVPLRSFTAEGSGQEASLTSSRTKECPCEDDPPGLWENRRLWGNRFTQEQEVVWPKVVKGDRGRNTAAGPFVGEEDEDGNDLSLPSFGGGQK